MTCKKAQMAGAKPSEDPAPRSHFSERPIASHKSASDVSGRRVGGQEAAGGAEINEEAQNEKEQQLETLVVTSGTEPEKTTLLSHLLRHYN